MKKLLSFANYLVGGIALLALAGGITYGSYTVGGVVFAGLTGLICLAALVALGLGMSGKFNEPDEKGFPTNFSMILLACAGLLILVISLGAGMSSMKTGGTFTSSAPISTTSPSPNVSAAPSVSATQQEPQIAASPNSSSENISNHTGLPPYVIAILITLAVLAILLFVAYLLKQGGDANIFTFWS